MASQQTNAHTRPSVSDPPNLSDNVMHPLDTQLEASQAQVEHRIAQREAGVANVPPIVASPTASPPHIAPPRSVADIQSDMDATRQRLVSTLDELQTAMQPRNIARKQVDRVRDYYVDQYGAVRPERVVKTAAIAIGTVIAVRVTKRVLVAIF